MPSFRCATCDAPFDVPAGALAKYPGWTPRFCREHSPRKGATRAKPARRSSARGSKGRAATREENLTLAQVLATYEGGPTSGVFTDGSAVPNPGPGGWGVVHVRDGEVLAQRHGHDPDTTNNRMELTGLIEAYRLLPEDAEETVRTDSRLCVDTVTKWASGWKKRGWKRKDGPIKNVELVIELYELATAHPGCRLEWIAAHSGHVWNEYADSLATAWMREEL